MCFDLTHVIFIGPDRIDENPSHAKLRTSNNISTPCSLGQQPIDRNMEYLGVTALPPDPNLHQFQANLSLCVLMSVTLQIGNVVALIWSKRKCSQYKEQVREKNC